MKKLLVAGFCLLGALCFMQAQNVDWKNYGAGIEEGDFIVRGDIGFSRHWKSLPYDGSMKVPYLEASVEYIKKAWRASSWIWRIHRIFSGQDERNCFVRS